MSALPTSTLEPIETALASMSLADLLRRVTETEARTTVRPGAAS